MPQYEEKVIDSLEGSSPDSEEELSEELQGALKTLLDKIEQEDQFVRYHHIYEAKQNDLYWHGFQYIYWDSQSHEFRIPTHEDLSRLGSSREEASFVYDYVTNIFKAHGLSIIAAIGSEIPNTVFSPGDIDIPEDVRAAKYAEKLGQVIHKKNNSKLILLRSLFILFTQHIVAAYNYYDRNKKYGTVKVPKFKTERQKITPDMYLCQECDFATDLPTDTCPECGSEEIETVSGKMGDVPREVGEEEVEKGLSRIAVYGDINVRVPSYAEDQESCGYLVHYSDQHISYLRSKYKHLREKLSVGSEAGTGDAQYEKQARSPSSSQYFSETITNNLITVKRVWIRPETFYWLDSHDGDDSLVEQLLKKFPDGCKVVFAGDQFAEAENQGLDERWTITSGDLSRTIHGDPLGKSLIEIQDIRNTTSNLLVECLEHSIPTNIADPEVFDFDTYSGQEIKPGLVYPGKKKAGYQQLGQHFYEMKTATLPKEGTDLQGIIDADAEFVSGSFPSVYGGPAEGGSKTLGEYTQSRNYALQRLSIPYQLIYYWWAQLTHKAILLEVKNMVEDSKYTLPTPDGRFESVWIQKESFKGTFELLIPESAVELPVSFGQKRALVQQAVQLNSEEVNAFLFAPERIRITLRYLGFAEFSVTEEIQAMKAMRTIGSLLQDQEGPIEDPAIGLIPSLQPEQDIDIPELQIPIFRNFLAGDLGQDIKVYNNIGYMNCVAYLQALNFMMQQQLMLEAPPPENEGPPSKESKKESVS